MLACDARLDRSVAIERLHAARRYSDIGGRDELERERIAVWLAERR